MTDEQEIVSMLQEVGRQLFPTDFNELDARVELLEKIRLRNTALHLALQDFIFALESLRFIASDYQLRLKAEDIWKQQYQMFDEILQTRSRDLLTVTEDCNIDIEKTINQLIS